MTGTELTASWCTCPGECVLEDHQVLTAANARDLAEGHRLVVQLHDGARVITGTVTGVEPNDDGSVRFTLQRDDVAPIDPELWRWFSVSDLQLHVPTMPPEEPTT